MNRATSPSIHRAIEAVLGEPALHELAPQVGTHWNDGRPREQPNYILLAMPILVNAFDSYRHMLGNLADPRLWEFVLDFLEACPYVEELPPRPPTYSQVRHFRDNYLCDDTSLEAIRTKLNESGIELAHSLGLAGACTKGSVTNPHSDALMQSDGTVIPAVYKSKTGVRTNKRTGEKRAVRHDADAEEHSSGDGKRTRGHKKVITSIRRSEENARVILDVDSQTKRSGGEARVALESLKRLHHGGLGAQGVVYDGALQGTHLNELMQATGMYGINKVAAAEVSHDRRTRVEKERLFDVFTDDACGCRVELFAREGGIQRKVDTLEGAVLQPLKRKKVFRRANRNGTYRLYVEYELPCPQGSGHAIRQPLTTSDEDRRRDFNRSEYLRAIPVTDPHFRGVYSRGRSEIEAINATFKERLRRGRARSLGRRATLLDLLGWGFFTNAVTRRLYAQ